LRALGLFVLPGAVVSVGGGDQRGRQQEAKQQRCARGCRSHRGIPGVSWQVADVCTSKPGASMPYLAPLAPCRKQRISRRGVKFCKVRPDWSVWCEVHLRPIRGEESISTRAVGGL